MLKNATKTPSKIRAAQKGVAGVALLLLPGVAWGADATPKPTGIIEFFQPSGLFPTLVIVAVAVILIRLLNGLTAKLGERFAERRLLAQQADTMLRFVIYILALILVVRSLFRLERETILALMGTLAVAVGFALKDLAASVLAGITILFDRPFQVGDRVTFGGQYGEVSAIGLRSVRMVTLDDSLVTIPNNKFLTDVVISGNAGALDMQIVMDFHIAPDADLRKAKEIVDEAVQSSRYVFLEKPVVVLVSDVMQQTYLATRLRAKAYVLDVRYEGAFASDVTERVKEGFAEAGIALPFRRDACRPCDPAVQAGAQ